MTRARERYPSDVSDEEWAFCTPYLTSMKEDAPQREDSLRELYNGLRWFVREGCPWRMLPNDLPPWRAVKQQTQRWWRAGCFETMAEDLRALLRLAARPDTVPTAVILDSRTLQSTPESGGRAGYDGVKRRQGSKVHAAVDTLGDDSAPLPGRRLCLTRSTDCPRPGISIRTANYSTPGCHRNWRKRSKRC